MTQHFTRFLLQTTSLDTLLTFGFKRATTFHLGCVRPRQTTEWNQKPRTYIIAHNQVRKLLEAEFKMEMRLWT